MEQLISPQLTVAVGKTFYTQSAQTMFKIAFHHRIRQSYVLTIIAAVALCQLLLLEAKTKADDQPLFDGKTFRGWTMLDGKPVKDGWEVVDGMIHLKPSNKPTGHIVTEREFGDLDLYFEWKISSGGNSGLKYRVRRYDGDTQGCEYQIIDDTKYRKRVTPRTSAGSLYGIFEPNQEKRLNPPGQFNSARIVIHGDHVQHWLNGRLIVSATIGSREWKSRVAESKFSNIKDFGLNPRGKLMLTDHGDEVWFRKFEMRPLSQATHKSSLSATAAPQEP